MLATRPLLHATSSMKDKFFVDTNVLVYTQDLSAGEKCLRAQKLAQELWESRTGVVSTQILQEFYIALRRKLASPKSAVEAEQIVRDYFDWEVIINNRTSIVRAIEMENKHKISFWDGLILQAAEKAGARTIYSEDLSHGSSYSGLLVINPFRS